MEYKKIQQIRCDYADVEIRESMGLLELSFDALSVQSRINPRQPEQLVMPNLQAMMVALLFIPVPKKALILGVGGGALVHFIRAHFPTCHITGLDYDASLLQAMQAHFYLPSADQHLQYVIADAKEWLLQASPGAYDLVICDLFDGPQSMPELQQERYLQKMVDLTAAQGALAMNLVVHSDRQFGLMQQTLERLYQERVLQLSFDEWENRLLLAFNELQQQQGMSELIHTAMQQTEQWQIPQMANLSRLYNQNRVGPVLG